MRFIFALMLALVPFAAYAGEPEAPKTIKADILNADVQMIDNPDDKRTAFVIVKIDRGLILSQFSDSIRNGTMTRAQAMVRLNDAFLHAAQVMLARGREAAQQREKGDLEALKAAEQAELNKKYEKLKAAEPKGDKPKAEELPEEPKREDNKPPVIRPGE